MPEDADVGNNGLHLVKKPDLSISDTNPSYPVDVVLVHGLNGHWDRTWTHANGTFWPKDLLPEALPGARIFSYGYPSQIFANKSVAGLRDFATHLLDELRIASAQPVSMLGAPILVRFLWLAVPTDHLRLPQPWGHCCEAGKFRCATTVHFCY